MDDGLTREKRLIAAENIHRYLRNLTDKPDPNDPLGRTHTQQADDFNNEVDGKFQ